MPAPRKQPPPPPAPAPKLGAALREKLNGAWSALRPDTSGPGLRRLALRSTIAAASVAVLATFANWKATGFLRSGGLDRLVSMKNTPPAPSSASTRRGGLDRGRLNSVVAAAAGSR